MQKTAQFVPSHEETDCFWRRERTYSSLKKLLSIHPLFPRFEVKRTCKVLEQTVFAPLITVNKQQNNIGGTDEV
jgi:hypothetical protein